MIHIEENDGITLVRMEYGKANTLDLDFCKALEERLATLESGSSKALILTGKGKIFSAGVNLFKVVKGGEEYVRQFLPALTDLFKRIFFFSKPVVAAINGHAIAGGCILSCCCDLRIQAEGSFKTGIPEMSVGVPFPATGLEVMRFALGELTFRTILLKGGIHPVEKAVEIGFADQLLPAEDVLAKAHEEAITMTAPPAEAFALAKHQMRLPVKEFLSRNSEEIDAKVTDFWSQEKARQAITSYLNKTLG